jgi:general secretion pathway protein K
VKTRLNNQASRRGIALVIVMLTIIVLSVIVGSLALSMSTEIRLARNTDYDAQMEWMGRSGVELACYALANKCSEQKNIDALDQFWAGGTSPCSNDVQNIPLKNVPLGMGHISVTITDMERKWDINLVGNPRAPQKEILQKALAEVGVTDAEQASTIIDSILDWMNPNQSAGFSGAKSDYYMHLNPPYYCKNGPIDDISELLLIKGITPEIYWGSNSTNHPVSAFQQHGGGAFSQPTARLGFHSSDEPQYPVGLVELFTALGGKLNVNTASLKTLQLIPGIDEPTAERIIEQRAGPDGQDGTDDDVPMQNPGEISGGLPGGVPGGFAANVPGAPPVGIAAQGLANYVDVRSYVFEVKVEAVINDYKRTFTGIVSRGGPGAQQVQCVRFYW